MHTERKRISIIFTAMQPAHSCGLPATSSHQERESVDILQRNAGTLSHAVQRVLGNMERNVYLVFKALVESSQQGTAACQPDTVLYNVGIQTQAECSQGR